MQAQLASLQAKVDQLQEENNGIRSGGNGVKRLWGGLTRMLLEQAHQPPTPCASVEQPAEPARIWRGLEVVPADGC